MGKSRVVFQEILCGLRETGKYIFSHHEEGSCKCYAFCVLGHELRLCSRCLGIWTGILVGAVLLVTRYFSVSTTYFLSVFLPSLTLVDWVATAFTGYDGSNLLRTFLGVLLGVAYVFGVYLSFAFYPDFFLVAVFCGYAFTTGLFLYVSSCKVL